VTLVLAAFIVAIELASIVAEIRNEDADQRAVFSRYFGISPFLWFGSTSPPQSEQVFAPRIWTPLTTTLLHGGLLHAAFNLYWLLVFGGHLELRYGTGRFLLMTILLAFASTLPQFLVSNYHLFGLDRWPIVGWFSTLFPDGAEKWKSCVGFSGVNYGYFGFLFVARKEYHEFAVICNESVVRLLVFWFFLCILLTRAELYPVANTAHFVGAAFGFLFAKSLYEIDRAKRLRWRVAAGVLTLLVLLSAFLPPPGIASHAWGL
jgi:GlpG protein